MNLLIQHLKINCYVFSTGDNEEEHNYRCITVPRIGCVEGNTLLADIRVNDNQMHVEDALLINCHPLTLGQRCADRFLLKVLISGTLAGKIISVVNREGADTIVGSVEKKRDIIQICFGSWFKRHNSNADMTTGTENEEPTIQKSRKGKIHEVFV